MKKVNLFWMPMLSLSLTVVFVLASFSCFADMSSDAAALVTKADAIRAALLGPLSRTGAVFAFFVGVIQCMKNHSLMPLVFWGGIGLALGFADPLFNICFPAVR